jgi:hypothetical protein
MKRLLIASFLFVCALVFIVAPLCFAEKPVSVVDLSNGFPSGPHLTLNIIAKWDHFTCPQPEYFLRVSQDNNNDEDEGQLVETCDEGDVCEQTDQQIFKNVIFFPREQTEGEPISVLMESGKNGPKGATDITELQVTDWCTESFPDDGEMGQGDPAVLRLPKGEYAVYARITGKTGKDGIDRTFVMNPYLRSLQDENGNNLIVLGLVDTDGVFKSWNGDPLERTNSEKKGKGVRKATNISPIFSYTGNVCYIQDDSYCYESGDYVCTTQSLCCADTDSSIDGWELCDELEGEGGVGIDPGDGSLVCPNEVEVDGIYYLYTLQEALCRDYEDKWIFSIGEFVGYLWDITTTGAYVVQVRFYPIDQVQ